MVHQALVGGLDLVLEHRQILLYLLHLLLVDLLFLLGGLVQLRLQSGALFLQFFLDLVFLGVGAFQGRLELLALQLESLLLLLHLVRLHIEFAFLLCQHDLEVLDLGLETGDRLNELSLVFEVCVPDQLGMVHLDHLQFLRRLKLLLQKAFFLARMCVFDLGDLAEVAFLTFGGLLRANSLHLVLQFDKLLRLVRLQLLLVVTQVFHLFLQLVDFKVQLALLGLLL